MTTYFLGRGFLTIDGVVVCSVQDIKVQVGRLCTGRSEKAEVVSGLGSFAIRVGIDAPGGPLRAEEFSHLHTRLPDLVQPAEPQPKKAQWKRERGFQHRLNQSRGR